MRFKKYLIERKLYHGSFVSNLSKLDTRQHGITGHRGRTMGIYLTHNPEMAYSFGPVIYTVKLKSKKILDMTKWGPFNADEKFLKSIPILKRKEIDEYLNKEYRGPDSPYNILETLNGMYNIVKRLKRKGYDGIAFKESSHGKKGITYAIWNKNVVDIIDKKGGESLFK